MAMLGMNVINHTAAILARLHGKPTQSFEADATIATGTITTAKGNILRRYPAVSPRLDMDLNGDNGSALPVSIGLAMTVIESLRDLTKAAAYNMNPASAMT